MVGRTDEQQTVVPVKAVQLVEEEGTVGVVDEGVQVLKDEHAWGHLSGLVEHCLHGVLFTSPGFERLDVQGRITPRVTILHDCLHADSLSVSCVFRLAKSML